MAELAVAGKSFGASASEELVAASHFDAGVSAGPSGPALFARATF